MSETNPSCLNVEGWRASTPRELAEFLKLREPEEERPVRHVLAVRTHLKPVDVYTYLRARFGQPNGFQNFLRRDDSDNLVHWDFNLKTDNGETDVYISGTSREVHILVTEKLTDHQWQDLIYAIRDDYRRVRKEKSAILRSLEKYVVFQNKFASLAAQCAELHESILETESYSWPDIRITDDNREEYEKALQAVSHRAGKLYGKCLTLRLLTPIMAEAYINMLILLFCKNEIRDDDARYKDFLRSRIPERLRRLSEYCDGFKRAIDTSTSAYSKFMGIINQRNFALHGNVDPIREAIEVVYFEGRRPIFVNPGNHIEKFNQHLEQIHNPTGVVADYEEVHLFLVEISDCLTSRHRRFFEQVISDSYPGYEVRKKRATRILPDHLVMGMMQGIRYDDYLDVVW